MKTGRNERCPCGSGLKYKRCCLASTETTFKTFDDGSIPEGDFMPGARDKAERLQCIVTMYDFVDVVIAAYCLLSPTRNSGQ